MSNDPKVVSKVAFFRLSENCNYLSSPNERQSAHFSLNHNIVWRSPYKGLHIYDLSLPVWNRPYPKKADEALELHCKEGPLPHLIPALLRDLPRRSKLVLYASFAENVTKGIASLVKLLLENKGRYHSLVVILQMPAWRLCADTHIRTIFETTLNKLKSYSLEKACSQVHWIIVEQDDIKFAECDYLDFIPQFAFSTKSRVFILNSHLDKPYIWGLYSQVFEDQAVEVTLPKERFSKTEGMPVKMLCLNAIEPYDFFHILREKLINPQNISFDKLYTESVP